jgi:hypothetical protein
VARRALLIAAIATGIARAGLFGQQADTSKEAPKDPHAVQPERPTVATHAGTVAPGWLEIEAGAERDQFAPDSVGVSTPVVFKIGLASHAQLSVFASTAAPAGGLFGVGDVGVGIKWRLLDDAPIVGDCAILPTLTFPTGSVSRGTGLGTTDASLLLISSHDFGAVEMDLNVGYTRRTGNGSNAPQNATLWTASFGGPFTGGGAFGWVAECYGFPATTGPSGQSSIAALLGGPTMLVRPWFEVDAGVIVPLTGPQPHAVYAGGVYNVGRLFGGGR